MSQQQTYTISDLAREFGITPRAIRFYEGEGLLSPERAGSKRIYSKRDRTSLRLILRGKRLGLSLAEIGELIGMYDGVRNSVPQLRRFVDVLDERRRGGLSRILACAADLGHDRRPGARLATAGGGHRPPSWLCFSVVLPGSAWRCPHCRLRLAPVFTETP